MTGNYTLTEHAQTNYCQRYFHRVSVKIAISVIALGIVTVFGLIGNIICLVILRRRYRKRILLLMRILAVADISYLFSGLFSRFLPILEREVLRTTFQMFNKFRPVAIVLAGSTQTWTTYMVVLITIDRYIAICKPLQLNILLSKSRLTKVIAITSIAAFIYNIPRLLELKTIDRFNTCVNASEVYMTRTDIGRNKVYVYIYKVCLRFLVRLAFPLAIIIVMNCIVIFTLRKAHKQRGVLRRQQQMERHHTMVCTAICAVFVACQLPVFISSIFTNLKILGLMNFENDAITTVCNFMLSLNSCVNIVVYYVTSRRLREAFWNIFCCRERRDTT